MGCTPPSRHCSSGRRSRSSDCPRLVLRSFGRRGRRRITRIEQVHPPQGIVRLPPRVRLLTVNLHCHRLILHRMGADQRKSQKSQNLNTRKRRWPLPLLGAYRGDAFLPLGRQSRRLTDARHRARVLLMTSATMQSPVSRRVVRHINRSFFLHMPQRWHSTAIG